MEDISIEVESVLLGMQNAVIIVEMHYCQNLQIVKIMQIAEIWTMKPIITQAAFICGCAWKSTAGSGWGIIMGGVYVALWNVANRLIWLPRKSWD